MNRVYHWKRLERLYIACALAASLTAACKNKEHDRPSPRYWFTAPAQTTPGTGTFPYTITVPKELVWSGSSAQSADETHGRLSFFVLVAPASRPPGLEEYADDITSSTSAELTFLRKDASNGKMLTWHNSSRTVVETRRLISTPYQSYGYVECRGRYDTIPHSIEPLEDTAAWLEQVCASLIVAWPAKW